ncbi:MAG: glycosyltransferase, partial [Vicinamibacterales bacterium]
MTPAAAPGAPLVSVVVPTRDRIASLRACLASMAGMRSAGAVEVLVVDDGSRDGGAAAAAAIRDTVPAARLLRQRPRGPAAARNLALGHASGEFIAFTDDDCVVGRRWLPELLRGFDDAGVAGVGGRVRATGRDVVSRYMDYVHGLDPALLPNGQPWYLVTANVCFRRRDLAALGGFDETFPTGAAEDVDLSLRLIARGRRLAFRPSARVRHEYDRSLESFVGRFYRYGRGGRRLFDKHRVWREWPPDPLEWARELLAGANGHDRRYRDIESATERQWFAALGRLEVLMFLLGYCRVSSSAGVPGMPQARGHAARGAARAPDHDALGGIAALMASGHA